MKLTKGDVTKDVTNPKTIARFLREGWLEDGAEVAEPVAEEPKRRGRPAKVTNGND